jgi:hypothetical protein
LEDFQSFLPGWKSEKRNEATTWPQLENEIIKYQVTMMGMMMLLLLLLLRRRRRISMSLMM